MNTNDGHTNDANAELTIGSRKSETIHLSGMTDRSSALTVDPISEPTSSKSTTLWEFRFLELAKVIASWSKDPSTQCGAVIVRPDKTIASVGFNGFPKGCSDFDELYADRDLKYERVIHAEVNAILHAREPLDGYTMYTYPGSNGPSCARCTTCIIQAGIKQVTHILTDGEFPERWQRSIDIGLQMYKEAGVEVVSIPQTLYDSVLDGQ